MGGVASVRRLREERILSQARAILLTRKVRSLNRQLLELWKECQDLKSHREYCLTYHRQEPGDDSM